MRKKRDKPQQKLASAHLRCVAFLGDLSLAHMIFFYLFSFEYFVAPYGEVKKMFESLGTPYSFEITFILSVFLITTILRFYSTLLLGVSVCQFLVGLRSVGPFIWKRIGGGARVVLEFFFSLLVIFDLPVIIGRRSLKEVVTYTEIVQRKSLFSNLAFLLIPFLMVLFIVAPLLQNLTLIDGIKVSFGKQAIEEINNKTNFDSFKTYSSNRFKFSSFSSLKDNRFILLPSFEVFKIRKKKKIVPYIIIYDREKRVDGTFKIVNRFHLLELLKQGRLGNPLFSARYPHLEETLRMEPEQFHRRSYNVQFKKNLFLKKSVVQEMATFVQSSFELSLVNLVEHLLYNGPFIQGYVKVRNALLKKIDSGSIPEVDLIKLGNHQFLRLRQTFDHKMPGTKEQIESLIPLGTNNSMVYQLAWNKDLKSAVSRQDFRASFLAMTDWFFDYTQIFPFPKHLEEMLPLHVTDYFTKAHLTKEQTNLLEVFIIKYYSTLCRQAIEKSDENLINLLISNLNRYFLVAGIKNRLSPGHYTRFFMQRILELKSLLKNRDVQSFVTKTGENW